MDENCKAFKPIKNWLRTFLKSPFNGFILKMKMKWNKCFKLGQKRVWTNRWINNFFKSSIISPTDPSHHFQKWETIFFELNHSKNTEPSLDITSTALKMPDPRFRPLNSTANSHHIPPVHEHCAMQNKVTSRKSASQNPKASSHPIAQLSEHRVKSPNSGCLPNTGFMPL